jgi:peroxiredoxin
MISVVYTACQQRITKVILSDSYQTTIKQYIQQQEYMVMIYVDSSDCTPCSFKHLVRWYEAKNNFEENGIGILLIFRNSDERAVISTLRSIGTFNFIFDKGGKFKAENNVFKYARDNIFVMDKDNNVLFTQSPLKDKETWNSFVKIITNRKLAEQL